MASRYKLGINPVEDFIFQTLVYGLDISNSDTYKEIYSGVAYILSNIIDESDKYLQFLDFKIENNDSYYKIIGNNFISAMWLSGLFPNDIKIFLTENQYENDNIIYMFNEKTKKLTIKEIKNGE